MLVKDILKNLPRKRRGFFSYHILAEQNFDMTAVEAAVVKTRVGGSLDAVTYVEALVILYSSVPDAYGSKST